VVGDIVKIKAGMNVPVDGIVIKSSGVLCNEAAMTGESDEMKKEKLDSCLVKQ
jgi:P-type E1-E2 ATPase